MTNLLINAFGSALYLSNLGGAHGHPTAKSSTELLDEIFKKIPKGTKNAGFFGFTNGGQMTPRAFLKEIGFTETKSGNLIFHYLSPEAFEKAFGNLEEKVKEMEALRRKAIEEFSKDYNERNKGRKEGELREGDLVHYHTHQDDQLPYIIFGFQGRSVRYTPVGSLLHYTPNVLFNSATNTEPLKNWRRVSIETEMAYAENHPDQYKSLIEYFEADK